MRKTFFYIALAISTLSAYAQGPRSNSANNLPMVAPSDVWLMPSDDELKEWKTLNEAYSSEDADLPENMMRRYETIMEENPVMEDLYSGKCSWYCGGEVQRVTASSHLKAQGQFNYLPKNAHDFNHESAWVEGAQGQGIGEWIEYEFAGACPRVTGVKLLPGYVKTKAAWEANSRPHYLKMYYNGKPVCILDVQDARGMQCFDLEKYGPFGYNNADKPTWRLRFEIRDVYPGKKYQDTASSELEFDGIDVH